MNTLPTRYLLTTCRAATCAVAATLAGALFAQADVPSTATKPASTTSTGSTVKHADHAFIEKAAASGREEVEIGRILAERSTNPDVQKFAQMMVDDHTKANQQLESIATKLGVEVKNKDKNENKWSKKDAKNLDRDYVKQMVSDHKKDIDLFTKESKNGEAADLVEFARNTLPTLEHHLEEASKLEQTVK